MGAPTNSSSSTTAGRLKREEFRRTRHDSPFSPWKILIGKSDWQDHLRGREGIERYRTQNLPNWISCPGVYELGIATYHTQSRRESRKLGSNSVIPVYLGQAGNLRARLQRYGRDGAHLENGRSNDKFTNCQSASSYEGSGLFSDIFARGLPIVYRCAPMNSKKDAEMTEKQLLDKFDYAWNKGFNGACRHDAICKKLDGLTKASKFSLLTKKFLLSTQNKVGIKIRACESFSLGNDSNTTNKDHNASVWKIFGIRRVQPRQEQYDSPDSSTDICGVAIGCGSICKTPPVKGRKRCTIHKGMRINGYIPHLKTEANVPFIAARMRRSESPDPNFTGCRDVGHAGKFGVLCGFILEDGSPCSRKPLSRNKRCLEHKGRRIRQSEPNSSREETIAVRYFISNPGIQASSGRERSPEN